MEIQEVCFITDKSRSSF